MLNFKPRLLHAALFLALPTLMAGYPQENAFAQTADLSASAERLKNGPILSWLFKKRTATPLPLTQPTIWLAQSHIQLLNHPEPHKVEKYTGNFDPGLKFAENKLNTHLKTTGEKMLKLAGGRNTLIKLDIAPAVNFSNPEVKATLYNKNGAVVWEGIATKPTVVSTSFEHSPGQVTHALDQSFLLMLPGQHLATGTELGIVVQDPNPAKRTPWSKRFTLNVGAPTVLPVAMFDFKIPGVGVTTVPTDAMLELGRKLLIKQLNFQRVTVNMDQFVFLPYTGGNSLVPHIRATSLSDWQRQAQMYSTDTLAAINQRGVDHSQTMLTAMVNAGGQNYISAYHGNFNDGTTGNFKGRGNSTMISSSTNSDVSNAKGVFAHEFSHNLDLYHWHEQNSEYQNYADKPYPYEGEMFGILLPTAEFNKTHNGPTWHYTPPTQSKPFGEAIPPFRVDDQNNKIYKRVISTSRAQDDKLETEQIGVFSDFDNRVSQHWLESVLRVYNKQTGLWSTWNQATGSYSKSVGGTAGVNLPRRAEPESVYSLVFATSVLNQSANLAYRPIGPYNSGIRYLYNPEVSAERASAKDRAYCPAATLPSGGGCDYSVKVVQGNVTSVYMLPIDDETNNMQRTVALTDDNAVKHIAINVPSSGGAVTEITIYKTPNIERTTALFTIDSAEQLVKRTF